LPFPRKFAITEDKVVGDLERLEELVWLKDRTSQERKSDPIDKYSGDMLSFHVAYSKAENTPVGHRD
jgi:hypothetical protein